MREDAAALRAWESGAAARGADREDAIMAAYGLSPGRVLGDRAAAMVALRVVRFGSVLRLLDRCPACGEALETELDLAAMAEALGPTPETTCLAIETSTGVLTAQRPNVEHLAAAAAAADAEAALRSLLFGGAAPAAAEAALEAADPWADLTLALTCTVCGHRFSRFLDIGAVLWGDVSAEAAALLDDVARLAAAFGWAEAAVLAMTPARRSAYLERLG